MDTSPIYQQLKQMFMRLDGLLPTEPHWPETFKTTGEGLTNAWRFFGFTSRLHLHYGDWIPSDKPAICLGDKVYVSRGIYDKLRDSEQTLSVFNELEIIVLGSPNLKELLSGPTIDTPATPADFFRKLDLKFSFK